LIKPKKLVSFADRLKQARLDMGARLSREVRQKEIAAEMGVEPSAYSQWEGGVKEPRGRATYERLAKILGIDSGWLAFGTETDTRAKGESITKKRDGGAKEA
jgi:transcriptional regulator with XRE-family HTH domain